MEGVINSVGVTSVNGSVGDVNINSVMYLKETDQKGWMSYGNPGTEDSPWIRLNFIGNDDILDAILHFNKNTGELGFYRYNDDGSYKDWIPVYTNKKPPTAAQVGALATGTKVNNTALVSGGNVNITRLVDYSYANGFIDYHDGAPSGEQTGSTIIGCKGQDGKQDFAFIGNNATGAVTTYIYDANGNWAKTNTLYGTVNPPPYPVTKVNNKTGAVALTYTDVGAMAARPGVIEFLPGASVNYGGILDFHYNNSADNFTSRIYENASGSLWINGLVVKNSNFLVSPKITGSDTNIYFSPSMYISSNTSTSKTGSLYLYYYINGVRIGGIGVNSQGLLYTYTYDANGGSQVGHDFYSNIHLPPKISGSKVVCAVEDNDSFPGIKLSNSAGNVGVIRFNPAAVINGYNRLEVVSKDNTKACTIYTENFPPPSDAILVFNGGVNITSSTSATLAKSVKTAKMLWIRSSSDGCPPITLFGPFTDGRDFPGLTGDILNNTIGLVLIQFKENGTKIIFNTGRSYSLNSNSSTVMTSLGMTQVYAIY